MKKIAITLIASFILLGCNKPLRQVNKLSYNDPFKETIIKSDFFEIHNTNDTVVEGSKGTRLVLPNGCFLDADGNTVNDNITIELAEALSLKDMLLSNLTTTSNGKPLQSGGMIFFNATADGKQLQVNPEKPIYIEIPTEEKLPEMMIYEGIRNADGSMNWINPKPIKEYLIPVPLNVLDFLPNGFEERVTSRLPYKKHISITQGLLDSLYYSLSQADGTHLTQGFVSTKYNEAFANPNAQIVNGRYTAESYNKNNEQAIRLRNTRDTTFEYYNATFQQNMFKDSVIVYDNAAAEEVPTVCGINPAIIKVLKTDKFENTLIATREFEKRLQSIFKVCDNAIIEIYINNTDLNMFQLDSMTLAYLGESKFTKEFSQYYSLKQTNVQEANIHSKALSRYYKRKLKAVNNELLQEKKQLTKALQEKNEEAQALANRYKKTLWKREKYRMESYGFTWSNTGWINVDKPTPVSNKRVLQRTISVKNGNEFLNVYTYNISAEIKSIYRLNSANNTEFTMGWESGQDKSLPIDNETYIVAFAIKNGKPYLDKKPMGEKNIADLTLSLKPIAESDLEAFFSTFNSWKKFNRIEKDLEFMKTLEEEKYRQDKLIEEASFISDLWAIAYPCCNIPEADPVAIEYDYLD